MDTQTIATAVSIALFVFCGGIFKDSLFPPVSLSELPTLEPISASKPISAPEPTSVGTFASAEELESAPSWEFQQRSLPANKQNLWTARLMLSSSIMYILISLMMEYLIRHIYRRWLRRESAAEQLSHLRILLRENIRLMSEWKTELVLVKGEKDSRLSQFLKEAQTITNTMEVGDTLCRI
jgi:hypothetical protein